MLPFAGGIEGTENGALVLALAAAFLYLFRPANTGGVKWAIIKTIPVALFGFIAFRFNAPWLLVIGLVLSAIGDWFLAFEGEKPFLGGLGSFFAAHIAYIALFVAHSDSFRIGEEPWRLVLLVPLVLHSILMSRRLSKAVPRRMKFPVFGYIAAISLMGVSAVGFGVPLLILGALPFIISDTLLAIGEFLLKDDDPRQKQVSFGVWIFYIFAQLLILFSFLPG